MVTWLPYLITRNIRRCFADGVYNRKQIVFIDLYMICIWNSVEIARVGDNLAWQPVDWDIKYTWIRIGCLIDNTELYRFLQKYIMNIETIFELCCD